MAFETVSSLDADVTIALGGFNKKARKDNETQVEGYYLGSKRVNDAKKKSGFSYIHIFQTPSGNLGVWGKKNLDDQILQVMPGTMVRATCTGSRPTPNGDMYVFKVEQDRDNTIVPPVAGSGATAGGAVDGGGESDTDDSGQDNDEGGGEQEATNVAALTARNSATAAAQQSRVQALLSKNKKQA